MEPDQIADLMQIAISRHIEKNLKVVVGSDPSGVAGFVIATVFLNGKEVAYHRFSDEELTSMNFVDNLIVSAAKKIASQL